MQPTAPILFDSTARRKHHARRAPVASAHDFLWQESAAILAESLEAITYRFARVLELAPRSPHLSDQLRQRDGTHELVIDQEGVLREHLPYAEDSFDAVLANLSLHTVNDLPGMLIQVRRILKPDGLFLATLPGAESLRELREVLAQTEIAVTGGLTPRVAPFIEVREAGNLLQRAGFALPVADSILLPITYSSLFALMDDLRGAGEANMLTDRKKSFTPRSFFVQAAARYAAQHGDGEGRIRATAELITLTAWKPGSGQQQPARRGSGTVSLKTVL